MARLEFGWVRNRPLHTVVGVGKVRRGGYIIKWFIGDHPPRHVHVSDSDEKPIGRLNLETLTGMEGWQPGKKLLQIIADLQREGRL